MIDTLYGGYRVLSAVYGQGTYLGQSLAAELPAIAPAERAAATKVSYGVLERDAELSYYIRALAERSPKAAVRVVLKESMYLMKYMEKPAYAVTDGAVELLKKMGKGGMSGFVNSFLRRFARGVPLPENGFERRCLLLSAPPFAVRRLTEEYGEEESNRILAPREGKTYVRFAGDGGYAYLAERGVAAEPTVFPRLFSAPGFRRDEGYDRGEYTFQSIGSVAVCEAVEGGGTLLDSCAAPGGKSVYLSSKFARVTAGELHPHRARLIEAYAARMGRDNVSAEVADASLPDPAGRTFDAVLCDAPCSGYGVLADNPDIRVFRTEENLSELVGLQRKILLAAAEKVKRGGALYYATCSVFAEENRMQADFFLSERRDFRAEEVSSPLAHEKRGAGVQFLPHISGGAGFYLAKFRRLP